MRKKLILKKFIKCTRIKSAACVYKIQNFSLFQNKLVFKNTFTKSILEYNYTTETSDTFFYKTNFTYRVMDGVH
jgi:hypothetical protein